MSKTTRRAMHRSGGLLRGFIYVGYYYGTLALSRRFGGPARWLYDRFQALWGGLPYPRHRGTMPEGRPGADSHA